MKQMIGIVLLSASVFLAHSADDRNPVTFTAARFGLQGIDTRRTMVDFEIPTLTHHHSPKSSLRDLPAYAAYLKTRDPFELDAQTDADLQEQINQFAREEVATNEQAKATLEKILSKKLLATLPHPHGIITNNASEFVPAPITDTNNRHMILTSPNTDGKSTVIKACLANQTDSPAYIDIDTIVDDVDIHCTQIPFRYHDPAPAHRPLLLPEEQQYAISKGLLYDAVRAGLDDKYFAVSDGQLDLATEIKMANLLSDELFFLREHCSALTEDKDALWNTILVRIENQKENASPEKLVELNAFHQFVLQRQSHEQSPIAPILINGDKVSDRYRPADETFPREWCHPLSGTSFEEVD